MKHSVIVSSYNRPTMIRDCLDSIKKQTYGDFEVIIMDDGSDLETLKSIKDYLSDKRFRCIDFSRTIVEGVWRYTVGINIAIGKVNGNIVHYLPDDDIFELHRFENVNKFMERTDEFMVGYGGLLYFQNNIPDNMFKNINDINSSRFPTRDISPENLHPSTGLIDHSQLFHMKACFKKVKRWRMVNGCSDCWFFHDLSTHYKFHKMPVIIGAKRSHDKCLMKLKNHKGGIRE